MVNGKVGLYEKGLDLAQRVGPTAGLLGGLFYSAAYAYGFVQDAIDSATEASRGDFAQVCFGLAFGAVAAGLGRAQKKATDLYVENEAEKRINSPTLPTQTQIPSLKREIAKQQADAEIRAAK